MYAKEIKGEWHGVKIPSWIRLFDCRTEEDAKTPKAPWGEYLYGSERAAADLGLRGVLESGERFHYDTVPTSCQTYIDSRTCKPEELVRQFSDAVKRAGELRKEYLQTKKNQKEKPDGGSCLYLPVAIAISNFGWSIISDRRTEVVRGFKS